MSATPSNAGPPGRATRRVLEEAVAARAFPGAVLEVGDATRPLWTVTAGTLTFHPEAEAVTGDTVFDLASLTKVLSTTPLIMQMIERGRLDLDDPIGRFIRNWVGQDRSGVTVRDLLAHCGGLVAWHPLYQAHHGRDQFEAAICRLPLEYTPRSRSIYSDLGFMLLGFLLDAETPLALRFERLRSQVQAGSDLSFNPPSQWRNRIAPTEDDPWRGRVLVGEVHDENAYALGGAAGHAGLFGTASAVGEHARHVLQVLDGRTGAFRRETLEAFTTRRADVPGSSRALGWDTALPTSSCGGRLSPRSFGHTGFTGTSLWIDPDRGVYVVLLTNRVHPTRDNDAIGRIRPRVHDAVVEDLG